MIMLNGHLLRGFDSEPQWTGMEISRDVVAAALLPVRDVRVRTYLMTTDDGKTIKGTFTLGSPSETVLYAMSCGFDPVNVITIKVTI